MLLWEVLADVPPKVRRVVGEARALAKKFGRPLKLCPWGLTEAQPSTKCSEKPALLQSLGSTSGAMLSHSQIQE